MRSSGTNLTHGSVCGVGGDVVLSKVGVRVFFVKSVVFKKTRWHHSNMLQNTKTNHQALLRPCTNDHPQHSQSASSSERKCTFLFQIALTGSIQSPSCNASISILYLHLLSICSNVIIARACTASCLASSWAYMSKKSFRYRQLAKCAVPLM